MRHYSDRFVGEPRSIRCVSVATSDGNNDLRSTCTVSASQPILRTRADDVPSNSSAASQRQPSFSRPYVYGEGTTREKRGGKKIQQQQQQHDRKRYPSDDVCTARTRSTGCESERGWRAERALSSRRKGTRVERLRKTTTANRTACAK